MRVCSDDERLLKIEAFFRSKAYGIHRHDTYAIGLTTSGVQSIHYRGRLVHSIPGDTLVIYPDEAHDGQAGTAAGYTYRIVHLRPGVLQEILGSATLPFLDSGVSQDRHLHLAARAVLTDFDAKLEPIERDDRLFELALALQSATGSASSPSSGDLRAAQIARDYIHSQPSQRIELDVLARASGRDRWSLSRDFRQYFGTSPSRYMTLRRLDIARRLMMKGIPLVECAHAAGFSDQSHMTRQFVEAFGLSPSRWLNIQR